MTKNKNSGKTGGRKLKYMTGIWLFAALAALTAFMYYGNRTLDVAEYELSFADLPEAFDGYKIAVVSDLHAAVFGKDNDRLFEAVRGAGPDIIALTGDATDSPGQIPGVIETVKGLAEIAPVYYVTGNHEWEKGEARELMRALPNAGARVLRNEIIPLERGGDIIYLLGLEDPNGPADMKTPEEVFAGLPGGGFCVTLVHRNTLLRRLAPLGAKLILCGHGHGGLIRIPGVGGLLGHDLKLFPEFTDGVYTIENNIDNTGSARAPEKGAIALVSRGVGNNTGVPRIFNRPHIPVAVMRRAA